jgi:transposase-like protein
MRRSREEQAAMLAEQKTSGESIEVFCTRKGIASTSFYRWREECSNRGQGEAASSFIQVRIPEVPKVETTGVCRIRVGRDITIECRADTHQEALEHALRTALAVCGQTSRV